MNAFQIITTKGWRYFRLARRIRRYRNSAEYHRRQIADFWDRQEKRIASMSLGDERKAPRPEPAPLKNERILGLPVSPQTNIATCFFSGKTENLHMHPVKGQNDELLGFLFVNKDEDFRTLKSVNWVWEDPNKLNILATKTYA